MRRKQRIRSADFISALVLVPLLGAMGMPIHTAIGTAKVSVVGLGMARQTGVAQAMHLAQTKPHCRRTIGAALEAVAGQAFARLADDHAAVVRCRAPRTQQQTASPSISTDP